MTFKESIQLTASINQAYQPGLEALPKSDRNHISVQRPRSLSGSINLDLTLSKSEPSSHRWDFGIAQKVGDGEKIYWVEIHPESTSEINTVIKKLTWLKQWLADAGGHLGFKNFSNREFIWISSGKTALIPSGQQSKLLASNGLRQVGDHLIIK